MNRCWDRGLVPQGGGSTNGVMMSRIEGNEWRSREGMSCEELNKQLEPFKLMVFDEETEDVWATLVLWLSEDYKQNVFDTRQEEGFVGNGYDWNSLANVFLEENIPELMEVLSFDSEEGLFSIGSEDVEAVKKFAIGFKVLCDDESEMVDLFSRAILD